jgi:hypothetical protein
MSALLFPHARGSVKRLVGPSVRDAAFRITMQGWDRRERAIITQAGVVQNGNFQFLHTINDQIFVYVFGDRISELHVSGVSFGTYVGAGDSCAPSSPGTLDVFPFYRENRIANRAEPLLVRIGQGGVFRAFLTGTSFEVTDPELQLGQFSYRFHSFPTRQ